MSLPISIGRFASVWLLMAVASVALIVATVVFETALGRFVDHKSWGELLAHYNLMRGELWPLVLVWLALTPFVWVRWTRRG